MGRLIRGRREAAQEIWPASDVLGGLTAISPPCRVPEVQELTVEVCRGNGLSVLVDLAAGGRLTLMEAELKQVRTITVEVLNGLQSCGLASGRVQQTRSAEILRVVHRVEGSAIGPSMRPRIRASLTNRQTGQWRMRTGPQATVCML